MKVALALEGLRGRARYSLLTDSANCPDPTVFLKFSLYFICNSQIIYRGVIDPEGTLLGHHKF